MAVSPCRSAPGNVSTAARGSLLSVARASSVLAWPMELNFSQFSQSGRSSGGSVIDSAAPNF